MRGRVRTFVVAALAGLLAGSCQPAPRDIRVVWRDGALVVDFPWSAWRLLGLQDRNWCIRRVELFDAERVLWTLAMAEQGRSCLDLDMPIAIGRGRDGFVSHGAPRLSEGVRYGVGVAGIGDGRVDFVLGGAGERPRNFTEWGELMTGPPGSYWGLRL